MAGELSRKCHTVSISMLQYFGNGPYFLQIVQTWEQMSLMVQRQSESGGLVRVHSDLASIRVGMMMGVATLRFMYTFEEDLPRRLGVGTMARRFSGAATFDFRRDGEAWVVSGHFFDDIGRSGQIQLRQVLGGASNTTAYVPPPAEVMPKPGPREPEEHKAG